MVFIPKLDWQDSPSTATPITAAQLIRIEQGIVEAGQAATETQAGNVELATATEMTTGTDLTRAPSVKRVADYVASQIASVGGVTQAYVLSLIAAPFSLISTAVGMIPLTIKRVAGQTADLLVVKDESEVQIAGIDNNGQIKAGGTFAGAGMFKALARSASTPLFRGRMAGSPSGFAFVIEDNSGQNKTTIGVDGTINATNIGTPPGGGGFSYSPMVVLDAAETVPSTLLAGTIVLRRPA